ncbi:MAG: hypothetical protein H6706_19645 [Myxococcales bacterium]|nr:hypothetical protein [Myxococcales bacterium]
MARPRTREDTAPSPPEPERSPERDRFVAAVDQGLGESEAGLGIDDEDLNQLLGRWAGTGRVGAETIGRADHHEEVVKPW